MEEKDEEDEKENQQIELKCVFIILFHPISLKGIQKDFKKVLLISSKS